jgi:hypothetical protein
VKKLVIICLAFGISLPLFAINPPNSNAVSSSLGGASAAYTSTFSFRSNIAAYQPKEVVAISAYNLYGISDYSGLSAIVGTEFKNTNIGLSFTTTPRASFIQNDVNLGVSKQLGKKISAGVGMAYHMFSSTNAYYISKNVVSLNAGLLYEANEDLKIGLSVDNPTRSRLAEQYDERLPLILRLGVGYNLTSKISVYADALQQDNLPLDFMAGAELKANQFKFRGGFSVQTQSINFGLEFNKKQVFIAAAASYHNQLGASSFISLGYALSNN